MTNPKMTFDIWVKTRVRGHSADRILWDRDKKQVSKAVNTKVFNQNLGDALDLLDAICDWAKFVKKHNGKVDSDTRKLVQKRYNKAAGIITEYTNICRSSAKIAQQDIQQQAWKTLKDRLFQIENTASLAAKNALG